MDQTLTCSIGGLRANGTAATVEWKDPDGTTVLDNEDYVISNGTPDGNGDQSAELTIGAAKLKTASYGKTTLAYKCSVRSALFSDSPESGDVDVVAIIMTLGDDVFSHLGYHLSISQKYIIS